MPTYTLAHLTDLHVRGDGTRVGGVVDARASVEEARAILTGWRVLVDAWVLSGDLSDDGSLESYAWLADAILPAAAAVGVRVFWGNGNHDDTSALRAGLGIGGDGPLLAEHHLGDLRVLMLDTTVQGHAGGEVSADALSWLEERLSRRAPDGTVLVMHHTPLPQPQTAAALWPLRNPTALAKVLHGSDVRLILGGHFHQTGFGTLADIPVSMATSLAYTQDVGASPDLRGQDAHQGFSLVTLDPTGVRITAVPIQPGSPVHPAISDAEARERLA